MLRVLSRSTTLVWLAVSLSGLAMAQDQPTRERQILRRAQQQVQKLTKELQTAQERLTTVEAEKAKLSEELEGAQANLGASLGRVQKLQQQLRATTVERDVLQQMTIEQKSANDQRLAELSSRQSRLERDLAVALEKSKQLEEMRVTQVQQISACEERNVKLYAVGRSVVEECRDRSAIDRMLRLEPFTGIAQVEIQNRLEAQRDQLDAQKTPYGP